MSDENTIQVSETDFRNLLNELFELRKQRDELRDEMSQIVLKHQSELIHKANGMAEDQCPILDEHNKLVGYSRRI